MSYSIFLDSQPLSRYRRGLWSYALLSSEKTLAKMKADNSELEVIDLNSDPLYSLLPKIGTDKVIYNGIPAKYLVINKMDTESHPHIFKE